MSDLSAKFRSFFKPDVLQKGQDLFDAETLFLTAASDTTIQSLIKGSPPARVTLATEDIASPTFSADCNCTQAAKGLLCKHIWATILQTEKKYPDFLESKKDLEQKEKADAPESPYKIKQAEYKKQQSEKMKARAKEQRQAKKNLKRPPPAAAKPDYPEDVVEAIDYFTQNGFELGTPLDLDLLKEARKKLSRIFHPDRGGSHDEATTLNNYYETLTDFLDS